MASILINPAITKIYKKSSSNQSSKSSCSSFLETIAEEKSFYLCKKTLKVSASGLFKNDRVLCIDKDSICYYSKVPSKCTYAMKEMQKYTPKVSFTHGQLHSVEISPSNSKMLIINVLGNVLVKGSVQKYSKSQSYKFLFANEQELIQFKIIMEKIIQNEKSCSPRMNTEDQYLSLLHNF